MTASWELKDESDSCDFCDQERKTQKYWQAGWEVKYRGAEKIRNSKAYTMCIEHFVFQKFLKTTPPFILAWVNMGVHM